MYRIRLHGRGGQGIKTGGRLLGSAFFHAGFEVQDAPLYGAERRGAPMSAFVRAARAPIRERGVVARPDLVALADASLLQVPAANVLAGVGPDCVLLLQSAVDAPSWRERIALPSRIVVLPAASEDTPRGAAGLVGAAARLTGAVSREQLAAALSEEIAPLGASLVEKNLAQALAAYDAVASDAGCVREGSPASAVQYTPPEWIDLPVDDATLAAPDIYAPLTMVQVRTGLWRTLRPQIDDARCNRCAWICSTLCPDSAIQARAGRSPVIDLEHCKGCMICVSVCPPHAIAAVPERTAQTAEAA